MLILGRHLDGELSRWLNVTRLVLANKHVMIAHLVGPSGGYLRENDVDEGHDGDVE